MASGKGLAPGRAKAAKRLLAACIAEPWLMAGTGFADTKLIEAGKGKVFTKGGAEGVHCGAIPSLGLGIAIKCDDGNARASDVMIAAVLAKLLVKDEAMAEAYRGSAKKVLKNWNGMVVGKVKAVGELG